MRPIKALLVLLVLAVALGSPVLAEQIIHFTNGDSMPIRSHEIKGDMIHVDLGGDGFIAFPASKVERIEEAGRDVLGSVPSGNQMTADPNGDFSVRGTRTRPVKRAPTVSDGRQINVEKDENGVLGYRPYADSPHAGKRQLRVVGDRRIRRAMNNGPGAEGPRGTTTVNGRHMIGPVGPKRGTAVKPYVTTLAPNKAPSDSAPKRPVAGEQKPSGGSD